MKRVVLVDGLNLLFKVFYGIPNSIKNSSGKEIKGLVGFIGVLKRIINELQPYTIVVIFDSETSKTRNLEIDSNYKQNRKDFTKVTDEENPFSQLPLIKKALDFLNLLHVEVENNEADDYIASIIYNKGNYQYIIVSTDSDYIQLIDNNVFIFIIKGKDNILLTQQYVKEKYGIMPNKYVVYKSLVGDKSDNIKGVKGIGPIYASRILKYGSIDNYIKNNKASRLTTILISNRKIIQKNQKLIKLNKNLDVSKAVLNSLPTDIFNYKTYEIIEIIGEK